MSWFRVRRIRAEEGQRLRAARQQALRERDGKYLFDPVEVRETTTPLWERIATRLATRDYGVVAEDDNGTWLGFLELWAPTAHIQRGALVETIWTAQAHRGVTPSIAKALLNQAHTEAQRLGADYAYCYIHRENTPSLRFFAKNGYEETGVLDADRGIYSRPLPPIASRPAFGQQ